MLSRVANAVYWTGRYIERAENIARFIDVNLQMSLDAPITFSDQWLPLVAITGTSEEFFARYETATRDNVIQYLTLDPENPSSIVSCLQRARENCRSIREVISSDFWEQINRFYLLVTNRTAARRSLAESHQFFNEVKLLGHLIAGVADNTMSHGEPWHFLQLGRMLERADNTSRLLDVKYFLLLPSVEEVGGPVDQMQWSILINSASAQEMYRKRFGQVDPHNVVEFLLLEPEFPRSILFCLIKADDSLRAISGAPEGTYRSRGEQWLGLLKAELAYANVYEIIAAGLHEFLDGLQGKLNKVGYSIQETFFNLQPLEVNKQDAALRRAQDAGGITKRDVLPGNQGQRRAGRYS
jgi:uncharacterized alpha-E superfamily protein